MSYAKRLKELANAWKTEKPAQGFVSVPPGKYQMKIIRAVLQESQKGFNAGQPEILLEAEVLTGEYKGKKVRRQEYFLQPANKAKNYPSGLAYFKGTITNLGLELPNDLTEKTLSSLLKECIGIAFNATVREKNGWTTFFVNDPIHAAKEDVDDEEEIDEDEDEKETDEDEAEEDSEDEDTEDDEDEVEEEKPAKKKATAKAKPKNKSDDDDEDDEDWDAAFDDDEDEK